MSHQDSEKNKRLHETIESLAHPDEQARELMRYLMGTDDYISQHEIDFINALLARVRLAEAEWWREQSHEGAICSAQDCEQCARVAKLRQAAGEGKP